MRFYSYLNSKIRMLLLDDFSRPTIIPDAFDKEKTNGATPHCLPVIMPCCYCLPDIDDSSPIISLLSQLTHSFNSCHLTGAINSALI